MEELGQWAENNMPSEIYEAAGKAFGHCEA